VAEKKYIVKLGLEERSFLEEFLRKGRRSAELVTRARILLKADISEAGDGWTDEQIMEALDTSKSNVSRTRQRLVETGFEDCMSRQPEVGASDDLRRRGRGAAHRPDMLGAARRPLEGRRDVEVTERRTAVDYAIMLKKISDEHVAPAKKIVLVQDNLNTHRPPSLYAAFPAAEARRLVGRFEWHYTPKHGSWLDMAESELSVLSRQCLDQRIPDIGTLDSALAKTERACRARDLEPSSSEKLAFFGAQQPGDDCLPDRSRSA